MNEVVKRSDRALGQRAAFVKPVESIARPGQKRGFTLFELLAVIVIMSVVTTLGTRTFFYMTSAWSHLKILTELDQIAEGAFKSMREDFANVLSSELSGEAVLGIKTDHESRNEDNDRVLDEDDWIIIPVQTAGTEAEELGGAKVVYKLIRFEEEEKGRYAGTYLGRATFPLDEEFPFDVPPVFPQNSPAVIDPERAHIFKLRFEYAGDEKDGKWLPLWIETFSPRAVRVSMTLADPWQPHLQVSRKAVFHLRAR